MIIIAIIISAAVVVVIIIIFLTYRALAPDISSISARHTKHMQKYQVHQPLPDIPGIISRHACTTSRYTKQTVRHTKHKRKIYETLLPDKPSTSTKKKQVELIEQRFKCCSFVFIDNWFHSKENRIQQNLLTADNYQE